MDDYIALGKVSGFFGVKGWVKLFSYTRPRTDLTKYKQFHLGESKQLMSFSEIKENGKHVVACVQGVDDRDAAEYLQGQVLYVKADTLPQLENGEYYWHQLIGLCVLDQHSKTLGTITQMLETGANDVVVVQDDAGQETLIPYVMSCFVTSIDLDANIMHVDWETD